MSDAESDVREVRITQGLGLGEQAMECPECGNGLPIDGYTECDRCGAHLELMVRVHAPGVDV